MFLKPFKIKTNNMMKGSERKKLRTTLSNAYSSLSQDQVMVLVPNKEEMNAMKVLTADNSTVVVYCQQKNPIFFEVDKVLYPTVYTLWQFPTLIPVFTTWPPVFDKLLSGADLMLPGIITEKEYNQKSFGNLNKLDPCAVNLVDNQAPVAVGKAALSSVDMFLSGKRGKGVIMVHLYSDHLWSLGDKSAPPNLTPPLDLNVSDEEVEVASNEIPAKAEDLKNAVDSVVDIEVQEEDESLAKETCTLQLEDNHLEEIDESCDAAVNLDEQSECEMSSVDVMNELLNQCFLRAWKLSGKKIELPVLTSTFYKTYMLPNCPSNKKLDVKKSSYKKLSKFLQEKEKQGFINVKELSKGVESITAVNLSHPEIRSCVVEDVLVEAACEEADIAKVKYEPPTITEMFTITATVLPLFKPRKMSKGDALTATDIRKIIIDYVKANELQSQEEKRMVNLDEILRTIVLNGSEKINKLTWDDLICRCLDKMKPAYEMTFPGQKSVLKKGQLEPVDITIAQRAGNKKVTLVNNLEIFGIDARTFAHEVQIGVAASTSVYPAPNRKEGNEVLIQGNQVNFIARLLLEEYKLPKKYVKGLEMAPKKKRK